ncbi:MAG: universal stress protein [Alphaproteobacteria bacterium]
MGLKTILACVSGGDASDRVLETARRIAIAYGSHIEALHVRADPRGLVPYTGEGMDGSMIEEIMEVTEKEGGERATHARETFDAFCQRTGLTISDRPLPGDEATISWREESGREDEIVAIRGRLFDLIAVGRPIRDAALPSPITLEAALMDTGRPVIVAPPVLPAETGSHVAIAWETSPEAARALGSAMPLVENAKKVTLLAAEPIEPPEIPAEEAAERLAWYGITAEIVRFDVHTEEIGAGYLNHANKVGADLLIKGAYARHRLRQMILGGRTRHIITHAEIPVVLCN